MNDRTRLELLERMLPAVRKMVRNYPTPEECRTFVGRIGPGNVLAGLVRDLDALGAAPATGDVVRLAIWQSRDGSVLLDIAGSASDVGQGAGYVRLGVVTLPLIPAEVEGSGRG